LTYQTKTRKKMETLLKKLNSELQKQSLKCEKLEEKYLKSRNQKNDYEGDSKISKEWKNQKDIYNAIWNAIYEIEKVQKRY